VPVAYFAPGVRAAPAAEIPAFRRLLPAGPWAVTAAEHPAGQGGRGSLAWQLAPGETPAVVPDVRAWAWRACPDGLWYGSGGGLPSQASLAREAAPPGVDLVLGGGTTLTIPLAVAAPRLIDFGAGGIGEPATELGRLAYRIYDRLTAEQGIGLADPDLHRLVLLAVQASYRVTEELLTDLGWISTVDLDPIVCAIFGTHPKASAGGAGNSPSPPADSSTAPSAPARPTCSPSS
jgi:hypothetical protein